MNKNQGFTRLRIKKEKSDEIYIESVNCVFSDTNPGESSIFTKVNCTKF
jgi:hypothetical protein